MKGERGMDTGIQEINVDEIMREIRENIKKRGYSDEMLSFSEVEYEGGGAGAPEECRLEDLPEYLRQINGGCEVSYYTPIPKKGIKNLVKCAIRKIMAFLILPILAQQNRFNVAVTRSLNCIGNNMDTLGLDGAGKDSKSYFENQERQTERLETKVLLLEQEIAELKKQLQSRNG